MISEDNRMRIERALKILTEGRPPCTKNQVKRAMKCLHAAAMILSPEERKRERLVRQNAQRKRDPEKVSAHNTSAVRRRWERVRKNCGKMSNEQFRELSIRWSAPELAALLGVSPCRVCGWRRVARAIMIPDEIADRLLELAAANPPADTRAKTCLPEH